MSGESYEIDIVNLYNKCNQLLFDIDETKTGENAELYTALDQTAVQILADGVRKVIDSLKDMCRRINALEAHVGKNRPLLSYQTHAAFKGWSAWLVENSVSNDIDKRRDIQAIKITFPTHDVYYAVYFNDKEGWSAEVASPETAGTTGKGKAIFGIKIRLDEADAEKFDICYRVHTFDGTWTVWAKNGEEIISRGVKLNAVQIKLQNK